MQVQPGLPCRLHRPWLSVAINRQQTLQALSWHYQTMQRQLPAALMNGYLSREGVTLLTLTGKDDQHFTLRLCADAFLDKEGEATLAFCDAQQTVLAEMTFTLCQVNGTATLFIGGMQGAKAFVPHEAIQSATKACHGLFPKRLLVEAAMTLGSALAVEQIVAVSNSTHIYRSWRYRKKKRANCWPITTVSGRRWAANAAMTAISVCRSPCRANRWRRSPAKSAPSTAAALPCWTA
ncbi:Protein of uncharacterised function (DUF535) [Leclercia adecarboxylata]|uniref:Protein of uncharacterized function (DUF535) n=1 Tax=Leclercia adecarboxylata TaxID=83655 RepID=A0A4V6JHX9_9ENTR|nr:Protein of uncharacterised function (DUF535) [Leclercia adecarboxylata]